MGRIWESGPLSEAGGKDGSGLEPETGETSVRLEDEDEQDDEDDLSEGLRRAAFSRRCCSSISEMSWEVVLPSESIEFSVEF
jgi:hypothetical protein